ncbi:unnamed protein product [Meganyctiphanes norvegica]|uniref:Uncharacterized protein n=1 Tax=Meganyctiphanes norvegica TaxID=48144 RepID=A0AAV2Q112_MEGNR
MTSHKPSKIFTHQDEVCLRPSIEHQHIRLTPSATPIVEHISTTVSITSPRQSLAESPEAFSLSDPYSFASERGFNFDVEQAPSPRLEVRDIRLVSSQQRREPAYMIDPLSHAHRRAHLNNGINNVAKT